jgi:hypothetical protein
MSNETAPPAPEQAPTPPPTEKPAAGREYLAQSDRTMKLQGREYLQVAHRVYAFRLDYPISTGWRITTLIESGSIGEGSVVILGTVINPEGDVVAAARKAGSKGGPFKDWFEKAETGAIGRALGLCGYGTLMALDDDDENSICDAPQDRRSTQPPAAKAASPRPAAAAPAGGGEVVNCLTCKKPLTEARKKFCDAKSVPYTHPEPACQVKAEEAK